MTRAISEHTFMARMTAFGLLGGLALSGCSSKDSGGPGPGGQGVSADAGVPSDPAPGSVPSPKAPEPEPAPDGAVRLGSPWLYVQTCADPNPCPKLLQGQAAEYCAVMTLGGLSWRLPTADEVRRFASAELAAKEGFHWTGTPYEEDDAQVWIVDPVGGQSTTIPRDRKPFTARCVAEPPSLGQ